MSIPYNLTVAAQDMPAILKGLTCYLAAIDRSVEEGASIVGLGGRERVAMIRDDLIRQRDQQIKTAA